MRLKYQLFLSLLFSSGLLIVLMYAFNSWSFNRGFLEYLNKAEIQKLAPMINELATGFEQAGDWSWLTDDLETWDSMLERYVGKRPTPHSKPDLPPDVRQNPPPPGAIEYRTPGSGASSLTPSVLTFEAQLVLGGRDKQILIGPERSRPGAASRVWIPIPSGDTVAGYLGYRQIRQFSGGIDDVFAAQQRRSFAYAALLMIALSGVLAVALAARIVRPVLKMNGAVSRISQGEYTYRIEAERQDEIGDLARNINRLATSLDQNLSARQQWLAEISHELRTPVAILQGELEGMIDGIIPVDDTAIASLHSESLRLSRLISDLHSLTLSDIGALDYQFESLDLVSLIAARCHAASSLSSAQDITVELSLPDEPLFVRGDRQRLEQLFDNLLQNSVRYTDPEGELKIALNQKDDGILISWEDSSPGLTDEQLPHLFDTLYRVETSRNRATGGAGLGLAIAKRIVDAHEGRISASQSPIGGLSLSIRFPLLPVKNA